MRMPFLNPIRKTTVTTGKFSGLNQKLIVGDGEFSDMQNMSDRDYPAISTREKRGSTVQTLTKANGLVITDDVFTVDETVLKENGSTVATGLADSKKHMIPMGANIVIMPDKVVYQPNNEVTLKPFEIHIEKGPVFSFSKNEDDGKIEIRNESSFVLFNAGDSIEIKDHTEIIPPDYEMVEGTYIIDSLLYRYVETIEGETEVFVDGIKLTALFTWESEEFTRNEITIDKNSPAIQFSCENNNRLWGCYYDTTLNEIYASKLGDPTNWNVFEGTAMDSYAMNIGPAGAWTGCIAYNNNPVFFKENWIFTIYGDKPANFQLNAKNLPGAKYNESLVIINDLLYYVGRDGVYVYDGVSPVKISENIVQKITDAVASQYDNKYYLSCKLDNVQTLLVYDTKTGLWDKEDGTKFDFCTYGNGELYYIENNVVRTIKGNASETINFYMESGDIIESSIDDKYISKFKFNIQLDAGSEITIYLNCDDEGFKRYGNIISTAKNTYTLPIIPKRCNKYRWRIEGKGQIKLLGVQRTIEGGTEINAVRSGI